MAEYKKYEKSVRSNCKIRFLKDLDDIISNPSNEEEEEFVYYYYKYMPVNKSPGTMNKICWAIENEFKTCDVFPNVKFDYSILKRKGIEYSNDEYNKIFNLYQEYNNLMHLFVKNTNKNDSKKEERFAFKEQLINTFKKACYSVCKNNFVLTNILLDVCYNSENSKSFVWEIAGEYIYKNILFNCDRCLKYPSKDNFGDIIFMGNRYSLKSKKIEGDFYDDI